MTVSRRDPHLGELAAALVDGALDHGARDRALGHLTRCDECRSEVDAQRKLKAELAGLLTPTVPAGLAERLRSLPDRVPVVAPSLVELPPDRFGARFRAGARPGSYGRAVDGRTLTTISGAAAVPLAGGGSAIAVAAPAVAAGGSVRPVGGRPATRVPAVGPGRRRRRYMTTAAGGLAAFALALAAVAAAGDQPQLDPVTPQVGTFILEHAGVTGGLSGPDAEVGVVDAAYAGR
jgi:hypothetical protein